MRYLLPVLGVLGLTGCEEYYSVDEACVDTLAGGDRIGPVSRDAMTRINCHRRLSGLLRVGANDQVQIAADAEVNYVAANPDADLLEGSAGAVPWLSQITGKPGFTGVDVMERLTGEGPGQADYTLFDSQGSAIWEYIQVMLAPTLDELPSGAEAVDELMRDPVFRQTALQPSWIDGAYAELDLPTDWYSRTGDATTPGGGFTPSTTTLAARVYYMLVVYTAPHIEHVDRPVITPKEDQINVPLYSWSENRNLQLDDGSFPAIQISYPITLLMGAIDPANYREIDTNQYSAQITNAAIVNDRGDFLDTIEAVHPGDQAEEVWPSGRFQRTVLALYADEPFTPATTYTVYADYSSPAGDFALQYSFLTASSDEGVDPNIGRTVPDGVTGLRSAPSGRRVLVRDFLATSPAAARP
jgi:hypothetical protein